MPSKLLFSALLAAPLLIGAPNGAHAGTCAPIALDTDPLTLIGSTQTSNGALSSLDSGSDVPACTVANSTLTFSVTSPAFVEFVFSQWSDTTYGFTVSLGDQAYTTDTIDGVTTVDAYVGAGAFNLTLTNLLVGDSFMGPTNSIVVTASVPYYVPEPGSLGLLGLGLAALVQTRRRRAVVCDG